MTLRRARRAALASGVVVLAAVVAGLLVVGGPDTGRRDRRDADRLADLRTIADALACHAEAQPDPPAPTAIDAISPVCLAPDAGGLLADPLTGAPYRIGYPATDRATVCADFEAAPLQGGAFGWPPFDAETGCVSVRLVREQPPR